jgi:fucose 4-O-acetylase-like acetyltransferase
LTGKRAIEIDAFKGLLICLIVLGHNTLFSDYYPLAFNVLYNFHVACFLLLPFLFFGRSASEYQFKDRAVRYLVPHFVFFAFACAAYFALFVAKDGPSLVVWLQSVALAVLFSSEGTYRAASGFGLFWFLPALLSLVLLRSAWFRGGIGRRVAIIVAVVAVHMLLGFLPDEFLRWLPWGWPLDLFLFPLALVVGELWRRGVNGNLWFLAFSLIFGGCAYFSLSLPSWSALAGDPGVYAIDQPYRLLLHDLYLVSAFLALLLLCWRLPAPLVKGLAFVGERSLFVFLAHSFVFRAMIMSGFLGWMDSLIGIAPISVAVSFAVTLGLTLAAFKILESVPRLHTLIFPRSMVEWRSALAAGRT